MVIEDFEFEGLVISTNNKRSTITYESKEEELQEEKHLNSFMNKIYNVVLNLLFNNSTVSELSYSYDAEEIFPGIRSISFKYSLKINGEILQDRIHLFQGNSFNVVRNVFDEIEYLLVNKIRKKLLKTT